jgi:hypothetical protein
LRFLRSTQCTIVGRPFELQLPAVRMLRVSPDCSVDRETTRSFTLDRRSFFVPFL